MADYIKKDDIIKWIDDSVAQCGDRYSADMLNMMEMFKTVVNDCLPFANVVSAELYQRALNDVVTLSVERKHGVWLTGLVKDSSGSVRKTFSFCSLCNMSSDKETRFCPYCGAQMGGES